MKKINILILATHLRTGGISSYILSLSKGLLSRGHRVFVVTSGGEKVKDLVSYGAEHISINIQTKSEISLKLYFSLNKLCRIVRENDIDIIHGQTRITQVIGTLLGQITHRPFISTCHGFFQKRVGRKIYPCWGERVIAISDAVVKHLQDDFQVSTNRIALISNGVEVPKSVYFDSELKKMIKHKLWLKTGPTIGIIARLSEVKGHETLIKAMREVVKEYRDASLLILGEGKKEESLKSLVTHLKLDDNVRFRARLPNRENILPLFDVFVMPSRQEGLGLSVMEAQAAGIPVVASAVGGLFTLIEHEKTGLLVPPNAPDKLADAIIDLLRNKQKALMLGRNARDFIEKNFSIKIMTSQTLDLYQEVIKNYAQKSSCL